MKSEKNLFTQLRLQMSLVKRMSMIWVRTMSGREAREIVTVLWFCEEIHKAGLEVELVEGEQRELFSNVSSSIWSLVWWIGIICLFSDEHFLFPFFVRLSADDFLFPPGISDDHLKRKKHYFLKRN
jgi:hypothetical protein